MLRAVRIAGESVAVFIGVFVLGLAIIVTIALLTHPGVVLELADRSVGQ